MQCDLDMVSLHVALHIWFYSANCSRFRSIPRASSLLITGMSGNNIEIIILSLTLIVDRSTEFLYENKEKLRVPILSPSIQ